MDRLHLRSCGTLLMILVTGGLAVAEEPSPFQIRPLRDSFLMNGAAMRRAFVDAVTSEPDSLTRVSTNSLSANPVSTDTNPTDAASSDAPHSANDWTVRIRVDGEEVAFGVIVRSDGYILTKGSRLQGRIVCELSSFRMLDAEYVAYHPGHDLALLKVAAQDLPVVRWQSSGDPPVGRWVITPDAQGSPRAVGVVSVVRREIPEVKVRGVLGIELDGPKRPARIVRVMEDSAAAEAGLEPGDLVTHLNDIEIPTGGTLISEIGGHRPLETLRLRVTRDESVRTLEATLSYPFGDFLSRIDAQNEMGGKLSHRRTGFPAVLQHDSVLKPEECGGPLVDLSGAAIGINIARAGRTETYAIPDDVVRTALDELFSGKYPAPRLRLAGAPTHSAESNVRSSGGE